MGISHVLTRANPLWFVGFNSRKSYKDLYVFVCLREICLF